jgi:luciferase family oxidoreductase group 1
MTPPPQAAVPPPLRLSILDLSPVAAGSSGAEALRNTLDLARLADALGYHRYWLAEHHNSGFTACPAPEVMIAHVACATRHLRVGSGGVMLPNHAPLRVAETFKVLEALHPGRIDLGLGRAPGTDGMTALALRRSREALGVNDFPDQLEELLAFLLGGFPEGHRFRRVRAIPEGVPPPPVYLLGSSDFSARLAGEKGLGFAFAHHINPGPAVESLRLYRDTFRSSSGGDGDAPSPLVAVSAICAETDERAHELARSVELGILRLYQGRPGPLPGVEEAAAYPYTDEEQEQVLRIRRERLPFVGSPATLREWLTRFARECGVGEVMLSTMVHDHRLRRRSYELLAQAFALPPPPGGTAGRP